MVEIVIDLLGDLLERRYILSVFGATTNVDNQAASSTVSPKGRLEVEWLECRLEVAHLVWLGTFGVFEGIC
jgi:hypothetical protein